MRLLVVVIRFVTLVLLAVVTAGLLPRLAFPAPDLLLLVVLGVALLRGARSGLVWGLVAGWLVDLVPPGAGVLGSTALTYGAVGWLAGGVAATVRRSWILTSLTVAVSALLVQGVRWVMALALGHQTGDTVDPWAWLLTTLLGCVVVPVLMHLENAALTRNAT
ncbi:rod shape-determining protein MreD [Kytococcus aerolatus]|uniref:Rod shape-determining protein MreD n=1 Tax=Kytococcus aerolatus TaxID=592308 RepID=A0A212U0C0_9MICO|nr:rod shape-determining protein MreD [Kytococcus aerolatus]SNC71695.1 rod shape-determining protein MreD [Kytococcus aerolatus]